MVGYRRGASPVVSVSALACRSVESNRTSLVAVSVVHEQAAITERANLVHLAERVRGNGDSLGRAV